MRTSVMLPAVLAALITIGGCGDDAAESTSEEAATSLSVTTVEYEFTPEAWTVSSGEDFAVELSNDGSLEHEWAVLKLGEDIETKGDFAEDKVLFELEAVAPGETETATFTVDEPGTYQVICAIDDHFDQGMEAVLSVE